MSFNEAAYPCMARIRCSPATSHTIRVPSRLPLNRKWLSGVKARSVYAISQTPQVWIDNQVAERAGGLIYNWDSVDELFPEGMLEDMFQAYRGLVEELASNEEAWERRPRGLIPARQVAELALMNATEGPVPDLLIHSLFERRVREGGERAAVITTRKTLSYKEVNWRAEELSRELRKRGVRRNKLVGVVMEKGWEQVVAVLGVEKAGGAYLPIEASTGKQRLDYILKQGCVEVVVSQVWLAAQIQWPAGVEVIYVEDGACGEEAEADKGGKE